MTCPLYVEEKLVGILFRSSRRANAFDVRQVKHHVATAERLAQAVEKTYRILTLERTTNAYLEMLTFVSHELKSPLASIVMNAKLIAEGYAGEASDRQQQVSERIAGKAGYLLDLVREYIDLFRLDAGELRLQTAVVNVVEKVVEPAIESVADQIDEAAIHLERDYSPSLPPLSADAGLLKVALANLVQNSVKYNNREGERRIRVSVRLESGAPPHVVFAVWNTGPGFPAAQRDRLFRRFSRIETPALMERKGTGVGLYSVWRFVRLHGGTVWADSREGSWAEFGFRIPTDEQEAD
jgi:signal transduction histidine kinase